MSTGTISAEPPASAPPALMRQAALAVVELAGAALLAVLLVKAGENLPQTHSAGTHTQRPADSSSEVLLGIAIAVGTISGYVLRRRLRLGLRPRWSYAVTGGAGAVVMVVPISTSGASTHLVMMAQVMGMLVVGPALIVAAVRAGRLSVQGHKYPRVLGASAAAGFVACLVAWHIPQVHGFVAGQPGLHSACLALMAVVGVHFWFAVTAPVHTRGDHTARRTAVLIAAIPSGLIGLALLIATAPIVPGVAVQGALTDQRLGGALMMLLDSLFLLPLMTAVTTVGPNDDYRDTGTTQVPTSLHQPPAATPGSVVRPTSGEDTTCTSLPPYPAARTANSHSNRPTCQPPNRTRSSSGSSPPESVIPTWA